MSRLRNWWLRVRLRLGMRPGEYSGDYDSVAALYNIQDPWALETAKERRRFEWVNTLISDVAPECGSLLELGCGEGAQTEYLTRVARDITGIDIGALAIERAEKRLPALRFLVGSAEEAAALTAPQHFDVVTLCEMLYFVAEPKALIAQLQTITDTIIATAYERRAPGLVSALSGDGWTHVPDFTSEGTRWRGFVWQRPPR